jgi:hypothetical protein
VTYRNRTNPSVVVEILAQDAQLRLGELRWPVVVYRRLDNGTIYVRSKAEFLDKFVLIPEN